MPNTSVTNACTKCTIDCVYKALSFISNIMTECQRNRNIVQPNLRIYCVIYRVFSYFKHHVYYVSINNFIYYDSINNFLEQHVYNNMLFMSLILDSVIFGMS